MKIIFYSDNRLFNTFNTIMTTETLAMFPLEIVVFPGERLALHIFEERYQQLIADCETDRITFGIPAYINNTMRYGTEVELKRVLKRYPSGASDIVCTGLSVFELKHFYKTLEPKLYAGADVVYLPNEPHAPLDQKVQFLNLVHELYKELDIEMPEFKPETITSFTLGHKIGLTLVEEQNLLKLTSETSRLTFLIKHLKRFIETAKSVNRTKAIIKLNGHIKNFDPLDFKDFTL